METACTHWIIWAEGGRPVRTDTHTGAGAKVTSTTRYKAEREEERAPYISLNHSQGHTCNIVYTALTMGHPKGKVGCTLGNFYSLLVFGITAPSRQAHRTLSAAFPEKRGRGIIHPEQFANITDE
eukprot:360794-Chlamydomonas_euryale.AAC.3